MQHGEGFASLCRIEVGLRSIQSHSEEAAFRLHASGVAHAFANSVANLLMMQIHDNRASTAMPGDFTGLGIFGRETLNGFDYQIRYGSSPGIDAARRTN